jgi:hypothetical protein
MGTGAADDDYLRLLRCEEMKREDGHADFCAQIGSFQCQGTSPSLVEWVLDEENSHNEIERNVICIGRETSRGQDVMEAGGCWKAARVVLLPRIRDMHERKGDARDGDPRNMERRGADRYPAKRRPCVSCSNTVVG